LRDLVWTVRTRRGISPSAAEKDDEEDSRGRRRLPRLFDDEVFSLLEEIEDLLEEETGAEAGEADMIYKRNELETEIEEYLPDFLVVDCAVVRDGTESEDDTTAAAADDVDEATEKGITGTILYAIAPFDHESLVTNHKLSFKMFHEMYQLAHQKVDDHLARGEKI
jgi:hypothetical protein